MNSILNEVKQTGAAIRRGRPAPGTRTLGIRFYYSANQGITVYAESARLAQLAVKGL